MRLGLDEVGATVSIDDIESLAADEDADEVDVVLVPFAADELWAVEVSEDCGAVLSVFLSIGLPFDIESAPDDSAEGVEAVTASFARAPVDNKEEVDDSSLVVEDVCRDESLAPAAKA